ncbi:hypothetical protein CEQ90_06680 [Lewinellaceae bacterium SD302]|nr:hypothetical protein CEQ90_06680 [Lewinellaceae bacterium SD302]
MLRHFNFFKSYLGYRVYLLLVLSFLVSLLDSIGLGVLIQTLTLLGNSPPVGDDTFSNFVNEYLQGSVVAENSALILLIMVAIFLFKGLFQFAQVYYTVHLKFLFTSGIRHHLVDRLAGVKYQYFASLDAGKLQNQLTMESQRCIAGFMAFFRMVKQYIMLSVYIGLALLLNPFFVLFCGIGVSFTNLLYRYFNRQTAKQSAGYTEMGHRYQSIVLQLIKNFNYLKATNGIEPLQADLDKKIDRIEEKQMRIGWYSSLTASLREPFVIIIIALALLFFVIYLGNSISAITVVILLMYRAMNFLQAAEASKQSYYGITGSIDSVIELDEELSAEPEPEPGERSLETIESIRFEKVTFTYQEEEWFEYEFDVKRGETLAIVGESGSGKTTLLSLLLGLYSPAEGKIMLNGHPITEYNLATFRSKIGFIDQNTVVFNDTVYNNVSSWSDKNPANLARFWSVMEAVNLATIFRERSTGEETLLGDNGMKVSGGQRQRISIARELFKSFDLLIMDEATASLDAISANQVRRSLKEANPDCIRILISHKLNSVENADRILLLDKGKMVARGTFAEVKMQSALFREMLSQQSVVQSEEHKF